MVPGVTLSSEHVPSSQEKKAAILCYLFVGIVVGGWKSLKKKDEGYVVFHLRQSLGWWLMFFSVLVCSLLLVWVPVLRMLPILAFLLLFVAWVFMVYRARNGEKKKKEKTLSALCYALGDRITTIYMV